MNIFINIAFLGINFAFLIIYLVNLVINIIRDLKAKAMLKKNPKRLKATVKEIKTYKRRTYLIVEYVSPQSLIVFTNTFEFVSGEIDNQYEVGQEIELLYVDTKDLKRVTSFPIAIEGRKIKMATGPLFTNSMLVFLAAFNTVNIFIKMLNPNPVKFAPGINAFNSNDVSIFDMFNQLYIILILAIYIMLITYLIDSLTLLPRVSNHDYLKIYGIKGTARVKTFKFAGSKNAKGYKEAQMEIEYFTTTGDKINARLSSYLYSETQEEIINIIYDPKRHTNVVYLRQ